MANAKHIHKLKRHRYKTGVDVFFCTLDCGFKIEAPLALGKEVLCNICGDKFIMNERSVRLTRPHCNGCGRREIKDAEGKKHYVRIQAGKVLAAVAADEVSDLRTRLDSLTTSNEDMI